MLTILPDLAVVQQPEHCPPLVRSSNPCLSEPVLYLAGLNHTELHPSLGRAQNRILLSQNASRLSLWQAPHSPASLVRDPAPALLSWSYFASPVELKQLADHPRLVTDSELCASIRFPHCQVQLGLWALNPRGE